MSTQDRVLERELRAAKSADGGRSGSGTKRSCRGRFAMSAIRVSTDLARTGT